MHKQPPPSCSLAAGGVNAHRLGGCRPVAGARASHMHRDPFHLLACHSMQHNEPKVKIWFLHPNGCWVVHQPNQCYNPFKS